MEQVVENVEWVAQIENLPNGDLLVFVESSDFTHDVRLKISGDFADTTQKFMYAEEIARRLNMVSPNAEVTAGLGGTR